MSRLWFAQPLETVRLAQLLSLGVLVISQHASPRDEALYADLVDFVALDAMPDALRALRRRANLTEVAATRARRFRERFAPEALVARALA